MGTLLAPCFLKTASCFRGKCNGEFTFRTSNLDVAQTTGYLRNSSAYFSNSCCVSYEC